MCGRAADEMTRKSEPKCSGRWQAGLISSLRAPSAVDLACYVAGRAANGVSSREKSLKGRKLSQTKGDQHVVNRVDCVRANSRLYRKQGRQQIRRRRDFGYRTRGWRCRRRRLAV